MRASTRDEMWRIFFTSRSSSRLFSISRERGDGCRNEIQTGNLAIDGAKNFGRFETFWRWR